MKSSANTNNDLKKDSREQLQIDVDLANATDMTAAWSFTTPVSNRAQNFTTPVSNRAQNNDGISDDWQTFYDGVKLSPPKATKDVEYPVAVEKANDLLRRSSIEEFANKSFEDLDDDQKAIMMLMVTKKMYECFQDNPDRCANLLVGALKPGTEEYISMMSFVRSGGDLNYLCPGLVLNRFNETCAAFKLSFDGKTTIDGSITIFDAKKNSEKSMKPSLYIQRGCSYICTFNACSALLYYFSYDLDSDLALKTNISKYIRDEISGLMLANLTLTTEKGARLDDVLSGLMKSFGKDDELEIARIFLHKTNENYNYNRLRAQIEDGFPFALRIENFPRLNEEKEKIFTGKISHYYEKAGVERLAPGARSYHAVVCIGIKPRKNSRPPVLLLQDSCHKRPAFSIGLDLLMDMGIDTDLQLCTVHPDWEANLNMCYKVTKKSSVSFAGSPMAFDKNGKPFVVDTSKKPVQKVPRDMSRYVLKNETPGQPFVYIN